MDDFHWIWQTIVIFYGGRFILRLAGRKSISQMTITQVIVMIGIGSLLIQPIAEEGIFHTLAVGLLLVLLMILTEYLEVKFDGLETISTGKAKVVINNGKIDVNELKKLRLSVDRLETRLRQSGINSMSDVKNATIEVSGLIGYELFEHKKPATKEDIVQLTEELNEIKQALGIKVDTDPSTMLETGNNTDLFNEVKNKEHEGEKEP
jgi:uncharacterized membrane protein YcaP (DUF421 family)